MLMLSFSAQSQNTKGDRAEVGKAGTQRESRFRNPFKKKNKRVKASYNRAQPKGINRALSARKPGKPGKASQKVYPQKGPFVNNPSSKPSSKQKAWRGTASGNRLVVRSNTGRTRNVYPQYGRYVNNPSRKAQSTQRPVSNKTTLARLNRLQGSADPTPPGKKKRVVPRSASKPFMARKSINVYANFHRPKKKGEQAVTRDIAGRPLRMKNYETPKPGVIAPTFKPYHGRKRVGDRPYEGPRRGGYQTATRTRPKAWTGDISGRKIRGRNFSSKKRIEGVPIIHRKKVKDRFGDRVYRGTIPGGGPKSASQPGEKRTGISPLPKRVPGMGAKRIGDYQGNLKGRRPLKGGGSVSGKGWNNDGLPIPGRAPRGGWQSATYQGNLKSRRPAKGGGSVSGKLWNNKQSAIPVKGPSQRTMKASVFPGNRYNPNPGMRDQGEEFTGAKKARRPLKGGGSVSGKLWNNNQTPLDGTPPKRSALKMEGFSKAMKQSQPPRVRDQGEEFTGTIRRPRLWKDYVKNDNAHEDALKKKRPTGATYSVGDLQISMKQSKYIKNKNSAEESMLKKEPTKSTYSVGELQIRMKQRNYVKNKNSAEESLLKQEPTKNTYRVGELQVRVRQPETGYRKNAPDGALPGLKPSKETVRAGGYDRQVKRNFDYKHNPSSADEALNVREPGKAFARSTDYQGNIKMKKFDLFEKDRRLHPDAKFVKTNKNNVDGERDLLTNFKLWWARMFRKQENQPENLKEKGKKPRYDKGEEGLWYE